MHNILRMETVLKISQNKSELAGDLAAEIAGMVIKGELAGKPVTIALSGGSTPKLLFKILAEQYKTQVPWEFAHFFWGDERCVPPHDPESNFGVASSVFLEKINIPAENIHRMKGEEDPESEARRYSDEIVKFTRKRNGLPVFDLVILGLGDDGHTASIFPGQNELLTSEKICEVAVHPVSGQKRISLTGRVINNADTIVFFVSGSNKAAVVADIIEKPGVTDYPAASIEPVSGRLEWYLDLDAASMLSQWA
jgi:6-phosphogluconolactonase